MIINILTILITITGILTFERAYEQNKSIVWHATKFWLITLITLLQTWEYRDIIYIFIPMIMTLYWIGFDIYWNKIHNMLWTYAGDGKGNFIELAISRLHEPLKRVINYDMFTLAIKGISLFISIILVNEYFN